MTTRPTAVADKLTFNEDGVIAGNVLSNDIAGANGKIFLRFFDGDRVLAKQSGQVTDIQGKYGIFHVKSDGSFTYDLSDKVKGELHDGETLNETVIYKVSDSLGNTSQSSLQLSIAGKTGPVAVNDSFAFSEGQTMSGGILENDIAGQNGKLLLRSIANQKFDATHKDVDVSGEYGVFHFSSDGSFTYDLTTDLADGQVVTETVRYYKVSDGAGHTDSAKVTMTITGTSAAPETMAPRTDDMNTIQLTGVHQSLGDAMGSDHGFMA